jgi:glyoxylase I family protein
MMALATTGLSHVTIRVSDLARARRFYIDILGFPEVLAAEGLVLVNIAGTLLGIRGDSPQKPAGDRFSPFRVGLDHLALAVPHADALAGLRRQLDDAGVPNHGVEDDATTGARYISFYDPDGIAWELYAMPR